MNCICVKAMGSSRKRDCHPGEEAQHLVATWQDTEPPDACHRPIVLL